MNIQAALTDVIKQSALDGVDIIKVEGTETSTRFKTFDADKTLFIVAELSETIPEFVGEFGITNLKMLSGLLGFTDYTTDKSKMKVRTRVIGDRSVHDQFEFYGKSAKSIFKLMDITHVPKQPKIDNIPWGVILDDIEKSKVDELRKFSGLYSEIDKFFTISVDDDQNLVFSLGNKASSSHSGSIIFAENVGSGLTGCNLTFPVDRFLMLTKVAQNAKTARLKLSARHIQHALLGVEAVTEHGTYHYYLRQHIRG